MSGPELVEELAARGSDVPIIFVSGYGSDELASRAGRLPALRQRRLDDRRVIACEVRARCSPAARGRTWKRFAT
jgi:hypothetical protein